MGKNVAVVGATGLVGRSMIKVLEELNFPIDNLKLLASERSSGMQIEFKESNVKVETLKDNSFKGVDIALFSAGKEVGKQFAPIAVKDNCLVIDNGSYWRMNEDVPLVVPEVNPGAAFNHKGIIANPNCSTIQLVVALKPIYDNFGIKRLVVSTYQSITGAGQKGMNQLFGELYNHENFDRVSKHPVAFNAVFHPFESGSDFTVEEVKMINEVNKILNTKDIAMSVTCVRLPVLGGHGESVNLETVKTTDAEQVRNLLMKQKGIVVIDNTLDEEYPTPLLAKDTNPVYVGRIRNDVAVNNGLYLWIVADNVRKGAATNAVQIAQLFV